MARTPLENGKKTKGRQRRDICYVEDKEARHVTFSKRKNGLWKKASELVLLCRAGVAIVVFSEAGKAFAFGSPSADAVLGSCGGGDERGETDWEGMEALCGETKEAAAEVTAWAERMSGVGEKVLEVKRQTGKRFWWEVDPAALREEELPVFLRALRRLGDNVGRHADKKKQAIPPPQSPVLITAS